MQCLIGLSGSAITQPVGSVLGTPSISRTWLRSSPVICAVDSHLPAAGSAQPHGSVSLLRCVAYVAMRARFPNREELKDSNRALVIRWVLFAIGSYSSILKILFASGVPFSKAWGLMFATSFLVFELAIFLYRQDETQRGPPFNDFLGWHEWINDRLVKRAYSVGVGSRIALLFYAGMTLKTSYQKEVLSSNPDPYTIHLAGWNIKTRDHLAVAIIATMLLLNLATYTFSQERKYKTDLARGRQTRPQSSWLLSLSPVVALIVGLFYSGLMCLFDISLQWAGVSHVYTASIWPILQCLLVEVVYLVAWIIVCTKPHIAQRLNILDERAAEKIKVLKAGGLNEPDMVQLMLQLKHQTWPLTMFVVNVYTGMLWYGLVYDPAGTSLPIWAAALG